MTSKGAKETIVSKLGFKSSSSSKAEAELRKENAELRKENAHLRRKMDELAKRHVRPPDSDSSKLLERILSLETLREKNNQQLLVKEHELETLRKQLSAKGGEAVVSLQVQLEQRRREVEQRDRLYQALSEETQNLKNQLAAVPSRCQNAQVPPASLAAAQDQLRDVLEKNRQWLVYDHQREAHVQWLVSRSQELEQQLSQALQPQASADEEQSSSRRQEHYDGLLLEAKRDLETQSQQTVQAQQELQAQIEVSVRAVGELQSQKEQVSTDLEEVQMRYEVKSRELSSFQRRYEEKSRELSSFQGRDEDRSRELSSFQGRYEEKTRELEETKELLHTERHCNRQRDESSDRVDVRLEEERKRSAELQQQLSAKDCEDETITQHQLRKVLKQLRKARDQISRLEAAKQQPSSRFSEPSSYNRLEFDPLSPSSSFKVGNLLDESFLECPQCHASYSTSEHRELLNHMDYCLA